MKARLVQLALTPGVALLLGLAAAGCWAQSASKIYTCKDANGKILTSDAPLQECQGREQRILGKDGTTLKIIPAPLTEEQKAAREIEDKKKKEDDDKKREQLRKDKALINTYENVDDIDSKRARALAQVEREARESERRMVTLQKQNEDNQAEAEFYKKKPMPADLKRRLDGNEAALHAEKLLLASKRAEVTQVNQKFDDDKKRYLELTVGPATPAPAPAPAKK
jgi:hypothetical protein